VLACSLAFPLTDAIGRRGLTFPRRQTYGAAIAYVGPRTAYALWGIDIGLGFTTYRVSRNYWSGIVMLAIGAPLMCFAGCAAYSLALFAGARSNRRVLVPERRLVARRRRLGVTGCALSVGLLMAVLAIGLTG
jgi:hypothetical protein